MNLSFAPIRRAIIDKAGRLETVWSRWFSDVQKVVDEIGGGQALNVYSDVSPKDWESRIRAVEQRIEAISSPGDWGGRIRSIERRIEALTEGRDWGKNIRAVESAIASGVFTPILSDHGTLAGLSDDDHTQYFLVDGTRTAAYVGISGSLERLLRAYNPTLANGSKATIRLGKADSANNAVGFEYKQDASASLLSIHFYGDDFGDCLTLKKGGGIEIGGSAASRMVATDGSKNLVSVTPQAHEADAAAVSAISASAGSDSIDLAAFNTALGTLVTEINAIKTTLNNTLAKLEALALLAAP